MTAKHDGTIGGMDQYIRRLEGDIAEAREFLEYRDDAIVKLKRELENAKEATVPVAEWCLMVLATIDNECRRLEKKARYQQQASKAMVPLHEVTERVVKELQSVREEIHGLPGWSGYEREKLKTEMVDDARREASILDEENERLVQALQDLRALLFTNAGTSNRLLEIIDDALAERNQIVPTTGPMTNEALVEVAHGIERRIGRKIVLITVTPDPGTDSHWCDFVASPGLDVSFLGRWLSTAKKEKGTWQ